MLSKDRSCLGIALCKATKATIRFESNDRGVPCEGIAFGCPLSRFTGSPHDFYAKVPLT